MVNAHRVFTTRNLHLWAVVLTGWTVMLCAGRAQAAMEIAGLDNATQPTSRYDRYENNSGWIGNPANWAGGAPAANPTNVWSGVGRDPNGYWGTMISPSFIISANHFHPQVGDTLQFNYNNDPNGASETRTVVSGEWLQASVSGDHGDVWIGKLDTPVNNVATYPILSLPFLSNYNSLGISTFGLSGAFPGNVTTVRLGRNTIEDGTVHYYTGFNPGDTGGVAEAWAFQYSFNNTVGNHGVGDDESQVHAGDSGGPTFFLYGGGTPALLGIHWLEGTIGSTQVSLDTFASQYISDIQTAMNQLGNASNETVKSISPVLGDLNLDGHFNSADVHAMESALSNLQGWKSSHGMNDDYLNFLADFNGDHSVTNADLQRMINILRSGGGSFGSVPEPSTAVLLAISGMALLMRYRKAGRLV